MYFHPNQLKFLYKTNIYRYDAALTYLNAWILDKYFLYLFKILMKTIKKNELW